jgi:hypothetical protein
MPTGDVQDIAARLRSVLPPWFGDAAGSPVVGGVLAGLGDGHAAAYTLLQQVIGQTRIRTASGGFLDLIAWDFFGGRLSRRSGESDGGLRTRILAEIVRPRSTRGSVVQALSDLTGFAPVIFEPTRPLDTGAYGVAATLGYGMAGGYGSLALPAQAFVTAYRPATSGIPLVAGYGSPAGGYGGGAIQWANLAMVQGAVLDSDIFAAIDSVKPAGATLWTHITNWSNPTSHLVSDDGYVLTTDDGYGLLAL